MANKEHLAILKQVVGAVEAWNQWREKNPDKRPDLSEATLSRNYLVRAALSEADLRGAYPRGADLGEANIKNATVRHTGFGDIDLSRVKGLDTVEHQGPSTIGIDTIYNSEGKIPEIFWEGAASPTRCLPNLTLSN